MADARYRLQTTDNLRANARDLFQKGKLAFMQGTPGVVAEYSAPGQQFVGFEWGATIAPRHPTTGTRGTMFGGGALSISTQTRLLAESWAWIKWITNKDNGVLQVAGGAGSPGAREDVWGDPRLAQINPIYGLIQRTYKTPGADPPPLERHLLRADRAGHGEAQRLLGRQDRPLRHRRRDRRRSGADPPATAAVDRRRRIAPVSAR